MSKAKRNRIAILLGILLFCCILTFAVSQHEQQKELIKNSDAVILTLETDSVTALSWQYEETTLAFHKEETWLYDEDTAFPADEEKINGLLELFEEFGVSFVIEDVEDYSQYGLDNPVCTIAIATEEQQYNISLGNYSTIDEKRYVSIGDGNAYLISHDLFEDFELELSDLIKHDKIPDLTKASEIQFAGIEDYTIVYEEESDKTYCKEDVYFTDEKPLDTSGVNNYLNVLSNLTLSEYVSYNVTEEQLQAFGLLEPELTVTVLYEDDSEEDAGEQTFTFHIGRNQEELAAAEESDEEDAEYNVTAYARVGDSQIVYEITSLSYANLAEMTYDNLRHKEVLTASFDDIYQIDITLEEVNYTLTASEEEKTWYYDNEIDISDLQSAVEALTAESFTDEKPSGDAKEEIRFTVSLNNETYPHIEIQLYRYNGENCLAVIDGESVSFVPRSQVVDLIEEVNAIVLK